MPHELSGGQRQRAVVARALAVGPSMQLLDEPTSGLDATVAVRILELIERLRLERDLGILLISLDLGVVTRLCVNTVVLYRGKVVERGRTEDLLTRPRRPYTAARRRSVPESGVPFRVPLAPSAEAADVDSASGCRFGPRCAFAARVCAQRQALIEIKGGGTGRCARATELGPIDPLSAVADPVRS